MIRGVRPDDDAALAAIYAPYVRDTTITFEQGDVTAADMRAQIATTLDAGLPWLVDEADGAIRGYAFASRWKGRCAYRHSVETTVYLAPEHIGHGLGTTLYTTLLAQLRATGTHTALATIALPNPASVALHERLGFEKVGHFHEVGRKFDRWIDVGYWQKQLAEP